MSVRSRGSALMRVVLAATVLAGTCFVSVANAEVLSPVIEMVSVDSDEVAYSDGAYASALSDDGRYIVFESYSALDPADGDGGYMDIYRRDRLTGQTTLVSESPGTTSMWAEHVSGASVSDDGNLVLLGTAQDLVPEDTNGSYDLYVKDVAAGTYRRLDFYGNGSGLGDFSNLAISGDGSTVVVQTDTAIDAGDTVSTRDIYAYDLATDAVRWVTEPPVGATQPDRGSRDCAISDDGRYVTFITGKDLDGSDTNADQDVYLYDMDLGVYTMCDLHGDGSAAGDEVWGTKISGDGSAIVFYSDFAFVSDDIGHQADVYRYLTGTGQTEWVTRFSSWTDEWDRGARSAAVSDDGRWVICFTGKDLAPEDTNGSGRDLYLIDASSGLQYLVDVYGDGSPLSSDTWELAISGDGSTVTFRSPNAIVPADTNSSYDVYAFVNPFDLGIDSYTAQRNVMLTVPSASGVLANDLARSGLPITVTGTDAAAHGTVVMSADGSFTYTPDAGYQGQDSFVYHVSDGTSSGAGVVHIDVVNTAPTAVNDAYSVQQDSFLYVAPAGLLGNDSDVNGDGLSAVKLSSPSNGTVTVAPDGSFTYAPTAGFVGSDSFTYKANDGQADSAAATVSITVNAGGSVPVTENGSVFRFYNRLTGTHFYTNSVTERDSVLQNLRGTLIYEGVAFRVNPASDTVPLYRFYNRLANSHFYTASAEEKARVQATLSSVFTYEGVAFNVSTEAGPGKTAIYRFFNIRRGSHFYTSSAVERDRVIATWPTIYRYEGIAFFVTP